MFKIHHSIITLYLELRLAYYVDKQYMQNTKKGIRKAPQTTGVYLFMDGKTPVYIGKAVNLKARLLSHLENAKIDPKERAIFENSTSIKLVATESEFKALVLEARLIQKYLPRYNKIWKDDKSYLYIIIDTREKYPKIRLARKHDLEHVGSVGNVLNVGNDGDATKNKQNNITFKTPPTLHIFGPFPSTRVVGRILREIRRVIPYCDSKRIAKKPCFHSKIGLCDPCPNSIEQMAEGGEKGSLIAAYRKNIRAIIKILEGKTDIVLKQLYKELKDLSTKEEYEEALRLRNRVYLFENFISERSGLPAGRQGLEQEGLETFGVSDTQQSLLNVLAKFFPRLTRLDRIECYDISNTSQKQGTAAMVVAQDGLIDKSQYRRFRIKDKKLHSDFEMLREIMQRRFRLSSQQSVAGNRGKKRWPLPDLVIVDGGRPQVRTLQKVFAENKLEIPVIGIAKNPDRLVVPAAWAVSSQKPADGERSESPDHRLPTTDYQIIRPRLNHPGFNLVRTLRDEAHRFSRKYHRLLRNRAFFGEK
jgi:excinuclease ABC subunit C